MKNLRLLKCLLLLLCCQQLSAQVNKAPAYPLITHDPYFSIWSMTDTLNASPTKHWTGAEQQLSGLIKVDGKVYRVIGSEGKSFENVAATADEQSYNVKYTRNAPADGWESMRFNDATWTTGSAPFSSDKIGSGTRWNSKDLWVRRTINLTKTNYNKLFLKIKHDDNAKVYLNGERIYSYVGWLGKFENIAIDEAVKKLLKVGKNVLAIHVANTAGGAYLDAGLVTESPKKMNVAEVQAEQNNVTVKATQTVYDFTCGPVDATITFTSPLLIKDLDIMSRPVSYITYSVKSNDEKKHDVQIYFGASTNLATNTPSQEVVTSKYNASGLDILKAGTKDQPVLQKKGDDLRIDWGYMYVATPVSAKAIQSVSKAGAGTEVFAKMSSSKMSSSASTGKNMMLNTVINLGKVSGEAK
ncbi:MAG: DUF5127 domain-containing protein, partial [Ginsengibacter sp.]